MIKLTIYDAKELNFVELNYTGGNDTYIRCDKESKYIDSIVFNLFAPCFENANKLYEYFGPTKYNARKLIPLRNELLKYAEKLGALNNLKEFKENVTSHFLGKEFLEALISEDPSLDKNWNEYAGKLIAITKEIMTLVEKCADEEKILWVVGY
jgi:hypothetical protein